MRSEVAVHGFPVTGRGVEPRSGSLRSWAVVLLASVVAVVGIRALPGETPKPTATTRHGLTSLPLTAQGPVSAALGRDGSAYRVADLQAGNPAQHFHTDFSRRGVTVASGTAQLGMALTAYGHGSTLRPVRPTAPRASANRVRYAHGALTEWYANGPLGIEQGFDVAAHSSAAAGPLTLSLALSGNLAARQRNGSVLLTGQGAALRYGGLVATDARGRVLPSWLQLANGHVLIRVADRGASYPLRIDPMIQQGAKLTGKGAIGFGRFGYAVSLSGDGDTALIGARYGKAGIESGIGAGGAWVFVRSGGTWAQQGGKLVGTGHAGEGEFAHVGEGEFGASVALSADGDTALIGGPRDDNGVGAAWVFTRSGSSWSQQGGKLTSSGETGEAGFGSSVALSANGDTALIGGSSDDAGTGAAWVFARSGSSWAQQGAKLTGTGGMGASRFGSSVALSSDGGTALVGGPADDSNVGAAWVFTRSGSSWSQQGGKLIGTGGTGEGEFGSSVALSADGATALIGAPRDNEDVGAAWVFTYSGSAWGQQGPKLTGTSEVGEGRFGVAVALSADGNTALIGGPRDDNGVGAVWAFTRSSSTWSQQGGKRTGTGETGAGQFGRSVALSANGNTALAGGPEDDDAIGGTWVLTRASGVWSQQGPMLTGGEEDNSEQGVLVALSADGNTALVGGWNDDERRGAVWVFTRSGGVWSQQGPKLTAGAESESGAGFGTSVALSADGNTALIGAPGDNERKGAAWVFTRSGETWSQQGGKLTPATGVVGNPWFGYTVALSGDGNTALIGGWLNESWKGAAWVFTRSGNTWSERQRLTANDEDGEGMFGTNVTLSADGNTALIGGWNDDSELRGDKDYSGKGATWIFTRSGNTWTQQGPKLLPNDETGNGKFGTIVSLSANGDTALIGGWNDDHSKGAAWVFTRSGATWTQQGPKLTGGEEVGEGRLGVAVALSADGDTALVGGLADDSTRGAAWLFTRSGATWTQQGPKIVPSDWAGEGEFGTNVALSADGATGLVGAWRDNSGTGAAWAFVNKSAEPEPPTTEPTTNPPKPPPPPEPGPRPEVQNARQSATRWREGNRLATVSRAKTSTGTTFSFSLNVQATVTFSFTHRVKGRTVTAGGLTFSGRSGANKVKFQGRLSSAKKLKPGRYTLAITATDSAGVSSAPKSLSFTIVNE
jgi:hypothetical protein